MQWIRENLFLTCLAGALIVCVAGAYVIRSGQDTAFENEDMAPRARLADKIRSLARRRAITKIGIQRAQNRLDKIKSQRDKVVREATRWNSRNYAVLQLKTRDEAETTPAFPHDAATYQKQDLTSKFTNTYRTTLYGALAKLDLTSWPVDAEIGELAEKLKTNIVSRRKAAKKRVQYALKRSGVDPDALDTTGADGKPKEIKKPQGVSDEDWYMANLSDADVNAKARNSATEELMLEKANAGVMFVSPETLNTVSDLSQPGVAPGPKELDVIFPKEVWRSADAPADKLWLAQLNLWITQDILAAIDATNDESLKNAGSNRTVPNSAIKVLQSIAIKEEYLMQAGADNTNSALTQRATSTEYEIVEYQFSVVMDTAHLPELMRSLALRGDHTVTNIAVQRLPATPDSNRYYGTQPVATVTIGAEVLFRADWTREIMPIDTLSERLSSVLRPEDTKRIDESTRR